MPRSADPAIEENGLSLVDFTRDPITIRMFRWNHRTEPEDAIDTPLEL